MQDDEYVAAVVEGLISQLERTQEKAGESRSGVPEDERVRQEEQVAAVIEGLIARLELQNDPAVPSCRALPSCGTVPQDGRARQEDCAQRTEGAERMQREEEDRAQLVGDRAWRGEEDKHRREEDDRARREEEKDRPQKDEGVTRLAGPCVPGGEASAMLDKIQRRGRARFGVARAPRGADQILNSTDLLLQKYADMQRMQDRQKKIDAIIR